MNALSLFSGAGGADLGITEAGIDVVRGVEHDADAVSTCHAAGLDHVQLGDVRDLSHYDDLPSIDLLFGGPPCQAFSTAGKREGQTSELNGWPWTLEVIDHVQPKWVLLENVPGLLCHSKDCRHPCSGCYWAGELLPAFRSRYPWVKFKTLNASSFGVPQHRRRVFLACGPGPIRWPEATHGDPQTFAQQGLFGRRLKPWASVGEALGLGQVQIIGGGRNPQTSDLAHARTYRDLTDEPSTTIPAVKIGNAGPWVGGVNGRPLTVSERATLQDFPDGYPFQGTKTAQYRQVGNAWPRSFGRELGRAIITAHRSLTDSRPSNGHQFSPELPVQRSGALPVIGCPDAGEGGDDL